MPKGKTKNISPDTVVDLVKQLWAIRGNIPQLLFFSAVSGRSSLNLRKAINEFSGQKTEVDVIVHSPGGDPHEAYKTIRALRENFEKVNIIVPLWAKSAATLISLGGTEIIMDEYGEFGPLDMQIGKMGDDGTFQRESALNDESSLKQLEALSLNNFGTIYQVLFKESRIGIHKADLTKQIFEYLARFYSPLLSQVDPYKLWDKRRKLDIAQQYAQKILKLYQKDLSEEWRYEFVDYLVNQCPDHGFVIDLRSISHFLKNAFKADHFGEDYKKALWQLSMELMESDEDFDRICFV